MDVSTTILKMGRRAALGMLLVVGLIAWANWYFSPTKRLERLATDMQFSALQAVSHEENAALMRALQVRAGGFTSVSTTCKTTPCTVVMEQNFLVPTAPGEGKRSWNFVVTVRVEPYLVDTFPVVLVPPQVKWRGSDWRGTATVESGLTKGVMDTGRMAQLDLDCNVDRTNVIAQHLRTLANGMSKRLRS